MNNGPLRTVHAWREKAILPTYQLMAPDKNPMFLEKRVYQGSSGRVYPLPFFDRIAEEKTEREWDAVWLENEFIKVRFCPKSAGGFTSVTTRPTGTISSIART